MNLSNRVKCILMVLLSILNIILRFQVVPREIGDDSFIMHMMANSLTEFGYARWILDPLSYFGLYPASYTSSAQFLLSGITQSTGIAMNQTILIYCSFIGIFSMLTAYLMAGELFNDDVFKFLVAFGISTSPLVVSYTTWSIPTRPLLIVFVPFTVYLLLKSRNSIKCSSLIIPLVFFLFATHHLFFFLLPVFFVYFILVFHMKLKRFVKFPRISPKAEFILVLMGFFLFFLVPFGAGKFLEKSRYAPIYIDYIRQTGLLIVFGVGGFSYLVAKQKKSFGEWLLLFSLMILTMFIYNDTYMKDFLPIFLIPVAGLGLLNITKSSVQRKNIPLLVLTVVMIVSISFTAYYQFLREYPVNIDSRYIEDSTYRTGTWMKEYSNGSAISNNDLYGRRICAASDTVHFLTTSSILDTTYNFTSINISDFKRYPISSEEFWFSGYNGPDVGAKQWEAVNMLQESPSYNNILYVVEDTRGEGNILWNHQAEKSKILQTAHDSGNLAYDSGRGKIWRLID